LFRYRRKYHRLVPGSPLLVHVGERTGLLSNLCEGGLAVNSRFPEVQGEVFWLAVDLPDSSSPMWTTAQTTWTSDSENRTGMRFVSLPATSREQLRQWVSAQAAIPSPWQPTIRASARDAPDSLAAVHPQLTSGVEPTELEAARSRLRRLTGLLLTVATLCSAFFFLRYYLGSSSEYERSRTLAPAATNPSPSTIPLDVPGFVLQVGAMTSENNANALSETLQRNDFPAFVFKRSNDRFYKVAVGPFADADSAAEVKRKLEKQGFQAILRRWSPE
jgi:sporulation related protein/PilZ domain-containing protein